VRDDSEMKNKNKKEETAGKMFDELNKHFMKKRITLVEYYDLAIKVTIARRLDKIIDILKVMSEGKSKK
jgi:hypothetical protein